MKDLNISFYKGPILLIKALSMLKQKIQNIKVFKNMDKILIELMQNDFKMSIISSNAYSNINSFLKKNNLNFFEHIFLCQEIFSKNKTIKKFIRYKKLNKNHVLYIGDEIRDIKAAKKAGIKIISVTWGYNDRSILSEHNPDYLIDTPKEILEILRSLQ